MDQLIFEKRKKIWEEALIVSGTQTLIDSAVGELCDYFAKSAEEVRAILPEAGKLLAEEWHRMNINKKDKSSVSDFYNKTSLEIFELMQWNVYGQEKGPISYVAALELAQKMGFKRYLDYGSGVGSGIILFLKHGLEASGADIATPLQDFIKFRLKSRNLTAKLIDLKKQGLKPDAYDIITCFDVLEHAVDPRSMLKELRASLKKGGILVVNNVTCPEDKNKPMHISRVGLEKKLRSAGFDQLWNYQKDFKKSATNYVVVLKKVKRPAVMNAAFYLYDHFSPLAVSKIVKKLRQKNHDN